MRRIHFVCERARPFLAVAPRAKTGGFEGLLPFVSFHRRVNLSFYRLQIE